MLSIIGHAAVLAIAFVVLWYASSLVIAGIERFAKNLRVSTFVTAFFILGILTSLSEISVGISAIMSDTPGVFVGNLIGASFVILLLIIPLLAVFNKGIVLAQHVESTRLIMFIVLLIAPALITLDGRVNRYDAFLILVLYAFFVYLMRGDKSRGLDEITFSSITTKETATNLIKISAGAVVIYLTSKLLIDNVIFFANIIDVSPFLVSLLILSVGTNIPELIVAINSIKHKHSEIAFGDYIGSSSANALLFGVFALIYGPFNVEVAGFKTFFMVMLAGYALFYLFARSKKTISPYEGMVLILVFLIFMLMQAGEIVNVSSVL